MNQQGDEIQVAIVEDGRLAELLIERPDSSRSVGDIYLGRVQKVVEGLQAAFIDIGQEQDGFLHFSDVGTTGEDYRAMLDEDFEEEDEEEDESAENEPNGNVAVPLLQSNKDHETMVTSLKLQTNRRQR